MISADENALICDFAEYYHIYDYRGLPAEYAATLAAGLREDSRIKKKMSGIIDSPPTVWLEALIADRLAVLNWILTSVPSDSRADPPHLVTDMMLNGVSDSKNTGAGFSTAEDFENARKKILEALNVLEEAEGSA